MTQPTLPTGARIVGAARAGVCGWWWRGHSPEGAELALLRIEPAEPDAAQRLGAGLRAVAALRHGGLLTTGEPIQHGGALWLVTTEPAVPSLAEVAESGGGLDAGSVATVAVETARTLSALHAAGLGHGAVHERAVVVTGIGAVTLAEATILPALRGVPTDQGGDRQAWAELVRWMVNRWCPPGPATDLLRHCARVGEHDLPQAVRELRDGSAVFPAGVGDRSGLVADVEAYQRWSAQPDDRTIVAPTPESDARTRSVPTQHLTAPPMPYGNAATEAIPTALIASGADRTELLTPGGATPTVAIPADSATHALSTQALYGVSEPTAYASPADPGSAHPTSTAPSTTGVDPWGTASFETSLPGPTSDRYDAPINPAPPPVGEVRFGPGVPSAPPTSPTWQRPPAPPTRPRRSLWRLVGSTLSALLTLALLALVGLHLWQRFSPLEIRAVQVAVPEPPGDRCDVTVDVVATVQTNGRAGSITYQWLRSGAEPGGLLTEQVGRGQRTVTLRLKWAFSGVGSTTETAVVNITEPAPIQGRASFRYQCRG